MRVSCHNAGDFVWYIDEDGGDHEAKVVSVTASNEYVITVAGREIRVAGEELHHWDFYE